MGNLAVNKPLKKIPNSFILDKEKINYIAFNKLNIYAYQENEEKIKVIENNINQSFQRNNFNFFYENDLKNIFYKIQDNYLNGNVLDYNNYNIILVLFKDKTIEDAKIIISDCLEGIYQFTRPMVILGYKKENNQKGKNPIKNDKNEKNINNKYLFNKNIKHKREKFRFSDISNEYIKIAYYTDENYNDIIEKLKQLYRYYNNIGDICTIMNKMIKQPEITEYCNENNFKYEATLNILVSGRIGCGKSTLINLLLDEKKAKVGINFSGLSNTKLYSRYVHPKYPIIFIDTPGMDNKIDFDNMKYYLNETINAFGDGKNKIHAILYLVNCSNHRYLNDDEKGLISFIQQIMKIPLFFVGTRALHENFVPDEKEFIKVNLKQFLGTETPLINNIECCQLVDENDGIYKKFGIENIINKIHEYFLKEKNNLKKIKYNFSNNIITYNNNNINLDNQIFLSSLKDYNYDYQKYFDRLCNNIIDYYAKNVEYNEYYEKIFRNQNYIEINQSKTIIMLIKNLAFELYGDLSNEKIKSKIDYFENQKNNSNNTNENNCNLNEGLNSLKNFYDYSQYIYKIGNEVKDIFFDSLKKNFQSQTKNDISNDTISKSTMITENEGMKSNENDNYFIKLINSYISAIDSLKNLYK